MLSVNFIQQENFSSKSQPLCRDITPGELYQPKNQPSRDQVDHGASDVGDASSRSAPSVALDLSRELDRIKTYEKWPVAFMDKHQMAATGFYYYGEEDKVRCFFCELEIGHWEEGDNPAVYHERWRSNCSLLRGISLNIPRSRTGTSPPPSGGGGQDVCGSYDKDQNNEPVRPEYTLENTRLESFKDWPCRMKQTPTAMADAGFFYTGSGDKTMCYYCGGGLKDWEDNDIPWEQHAQWFPKCHYLRTVKGEDYIKRIRSGAASADFDGSQVKTAPSPPQPSESVPRLSPESNSTNANDSTLCKLCFSEERNICFVPCGHVVACPKCALSIKMCPVCRERFTSTMRLYYS